MARVLITSGPTRQYIDPVRYLTNASSGRMGCSLAEAALAAGHEVVIVSGPVTVTYPSEATIKWVTTTEEMLEVAREQFATSDGLIGVAAPCDYRPEFVQGQKISKTGQPLVLELIETPDIVATLGAEKGSRWVVGFALETEDRRFRALVKLEKKSCNLMVLNGPEAMNSDDNQVEVLAKDGTVVASLSGSKPEVATQIMEIVGNQLIDA